jgi:HPt (histidine-containing phosphotransfer) domain-containing protein
LPEPSHHIDATIAALWREAQPRMLARVDVLERACAALRAGGLPPDAADHARREAHKLAGALGTFGMPDGTDHARTVEHRLEAGARPEHAPALAAAAEALRRIIEAGPHAHRSRQHGRPQPPRPEDVGP